MPQTEIPESHRDLLDAPFATLGTVDRRGRPQLSQVVFLAEDGVVRISLNSSRAKTGHLTRDPRAALLIVDPASPFRYLELSGEAELADDDGSFVARAGAKYGQDFTEHDRPGERRVVATIRPRRVYAADLRG
ncbi:MAG TPA: PPOX class F420-dependent oxidoreductase [Miltoncostaeaceae bacterium]|nr:PPOX class F420-dependent oxidoreductase [Miltoncostaeaceae bacterium]